MATSIPSSLSYSTSNNLWPRSVVHRVNIVMIGDRVKSQIVLGCGVCPRTIVSCLVASAAVHRCDVDPLV